MELFKTFIRGSYPFAEGFLFQAGFSVQSFFYFEGKGREGLGFQHETSRTS